jgi:hypothetical protein
MIKKKKKNDTRKRRSKKSNAWNQINKIKKKLNK